MLLKEVDFLLDFRHLLLLQQLPVDIAVDERERAVTAADGCSGSRDRPHDSEVAEGVALYHIFGDVVFEN